jgi:two-component SAPR family response regulator
MEEKTSVTTIQQVTQQSAVPMVPSNEMEQLQLLIDSKSLPGSIKNIAQAYTIAQFGKDLGMKPMQAFHQIYNIQGRLALSSKALGALLWANGIKYKTIKDFERTVTQGKDGKDIVEYTTTIEFYRDDIVDQATFKWSDAKRAGWTEKDNLVKMPKHMLYARALALGANRIAPDKVLGLYTVEEVVDITPGVNNVSINEEGDVKIV